MDWSKGASEIPPQDVDCIHCGTIHDHKPGGRIMQQYERRPELSN